MENTPIEKNELTGPTNNGVISGSSQIKTLEEQRLERIEAQMLQADKNFEQISNVLQKLGPLMELSDQIKARQEQAATQPQQAPTAALGGLGEMAPLLAQFLKSAPEADNAWVELGKKALTSQIEMSQAITNAVVSKLIGKSTSEVADAVAPG